MGIHKVVVVVFVGLVLAACGPSAAQIKTARTAHYQVEASRLFQAAVAALHANDYRIAAADPVSGVAHTVPRWYEHDGTFVMKDRDDNVIRHNMMVLLTIEVTVVADGPTFHVVFKPIAREYRSGFSALFTLTENEPPVSSWIRGKVDNVYVSLYDTMKAQAVRPGS